MSVTDRFLDTHLIPGDAEPIGRFDSSLSERSSPPVLAKLLTELVGTFFLATAVCILAGEGSPMAAFGIAGTLCVSIFAFGHIGGAHYNPSVTLGIFLSGRTQISIREAFAYIVVQLVGAFLGAVTSLAFLKKDATPMLAQANGEVFFAELLYTFLLVTVVLNVATTNSQDGNSFFGLAIAGTVFSGIITVGSFSGAVFNPAIAVAIASRGSFAEAKAPWKSVWIYWLSQVLASILAGGFFWLTNYRTEFNSGKRNFKF